MSMTRMALAGLALAGGAAALGVIFAGYGHPAMSLALGALAACL